MGILTQLHDSCRDSDFVFAHARVLLITSLFTNRLFVSQETSDMKQATLKSSIWKLKHIGLPAELSMLSSLQIGGSIYLLVFYYLSATCFQSLSKSQFSHRSYTVQTVSLNEQHQYFGTYYTPCNISTNCYLVIDLFSQASVHFC